METGPVPFVIRTWRPICRFLDSANAKAGFVFQPADQDKPVRFSSANQIIKLDKPTDSEIDKLIIVGQFGYSAQVRKVSVLCNGFWIIKVKTLFDKWKMGKFGSGDGTLYLFTGGCSQQTDGVRCPVIFLLDSSADEDFIPHRQAWFNSARHHRWISLDPSQTGIASIDRREFPRFIIAPGDRQ